MFSLEKGGRSDVFSFCPGLGVNLLSRLSQEFCSDSTFLPQASGSPPDSLALSSWLSAPHLHLPFAAPAPGCSGLQVGPYRGAGLSPQGHSSWAWLQGWRLGQIPSWSYGFSGLGNSLPGTEEATLVPGVLDCLGKVLTHRLFLLAC